ncbi:hypothetical protein ACHAXM_007073 [Skeletonema potamos]
MTSKFKPVVLYATDFYKLSSLLVQRVLLTKPANLAAYKEKTKQLLLDQSRPSSSSPPNLAAIKLLQWDKEFGLLKYYGIQEYVRTWFNSRSSISQATEQGGTSPKNNNSTSARVAFMITSEQRQKLSVDLGYTQQDIRSFKPIESLLLIENNVKKTSDDGDAQYNFRDRLKELIDENEKLMVEQKSSSFGASEEFKETVLEKTYSVSPEEAEQAHVKADVAMALLLAEKGEQNIEGLKAAKDEEIPDEAPINDAAVTSAVALIDDHDIQKNSTYTSIKSTLTSSQPPQLVQVTPNDSTELRMKPDVAAAFISSHLQEEKEQRSGMSDISDNEEETEAEGGPCWYEVVRCIKLGKEPVDMYVVVALFATKEEALDDVKKRIASSKDKSVSYSVEKACFRER